MFTVDIEDNELLADEITTLASQINAANYRFLKLVAVFLLGHIFRSEYQTHFYGAGGRIFDAPGNCSANFRNLKSVKKCQTTKTAPAEIYITPIGMFHLMLLK